MASLKQRIVDLAAVVRLREWYDTKLQIFLVALCYALLRVPASGWRQWPIALALFAVLCLYAAFGHIINDYADLEADRRAGKQKRLATWSKPAGHLAIAMLCAGAAAIAPGLGSAAAALTVAAFILAAVYSLPPVRLKERGLLGWFSAAMAQRTLPVVIIFQALHVWDVGTVALTLLSTWIGLRFIIIHQLADRRNDMGADVRTLATEQDPRILLILLRLVFALEIVSLIATVLAMAVAAPLIGTGALIYAVGLAAVLRLGAPVDATSYFVFAGYYHVVWPISVALQLGLRDPAFLPLAVLAAGLAQHQARFKYRQARVLFRLRKGR